MLMGFSPNIRIASNRTVLLLLFILVGTSTASTEIVLLESPGCAKCVAAERVINSFLAEYPDLKLVSFYYYSDEGHRIIKEKGIKGDIPAIIIGSIVLSYSDYNGNEDKLRQLIGDALAGQIHPENVSQGYGSLNKEVFNQNRTGLRGYLGTNVDLSNLSFSSILAVLFFGLIAGFNPCLLGILIFLAASVISGSERRNEMVVLVMFFSFGIFVTYLLFGLGMQRLLQDEAVASAFRYSLIIILIVIGLINLEDARRLSQGKDSLFKTDWALKYIQSGASSKKLISYFLIGALFSLVKAPCVGAVYLAILDLIDAQSYIDGLIYLIFYNLGVILPILILGGFIAFGMSPEYVDNFRKNYRAGIRLITGLTLFLLVPLIYWQLI
ncbi:MAG: sulfite exporter TauE/SafE family protein [Methanotrichaceae archaeon]|nr:sulfite exporter TauE/SafE family protein [Methanotrichaceae archaeon]